MDRLRTVLRHRVEIARRWHRLKTAEEFCEFVEQDSDIAALLEDKQIQKQIVIQAIKIILDQADADLEGCRKEFGREMVDRILAKRERYLAEIEDDET
jgi:hypothetical protein